MHRLLMTFFALVFLDQAAAQAAFKGCYQRVYADNELETTQVVDGVQVQLGQTGGGEEDEDALAIKVMFSTALFFARLNCSTQGNGAICKTDNAGEQLRLDPTPKGLKLTLLSDIRVPEEGMGGYVSLDVKKDDAKGVYALVKKSSSYCDKSNLK